MGPAGWEIAERNTEIGFSAKGMGRRERHSPGGGSFHR